MVLQALIFDKDGVLIDSEPGKCEAMRRALSQFGYADLDGFEEWFFGRVGMPGVESSQFCVDHFRLTGVEPRALYDKTEDIRREMIKTDPAPVIKSSTEFLKDVHAYGLKIGV